MEKKRTNDSFNAGQLGGGRIKGRSVSPIWTPTTFIYKPEFLGSLAFVALLTLRNVPSVALVL
jgi:hypothetical protein